MAVYTEVSDEELRAFIATYDIGEVVSFKGIAEGVENSNYMLQTGRGPFILTLYERRVNPDDLPFFIKLMEHLAASGVACPLPLKDREGRDLRTLCGRPAAIITFLKGLWPRKITAEHCAELGPALARMHAISLSFPMRRENNLSLAGWRQLHERIGDTATQVEPGLQDFIRAELDDLGAAWPQQGAKDLPVGVIHADLFPDNVFFLDGKCSGFIDFYFACTDFLAYDIAVCLNAWCFEPDGAFNITKASRLLTGYETMRPLTAAEKKVLPLLCRGGAMRFLLTRLFDWVNTPPGAMVKRKDPREYLQKLKFHRTVDSISAYGLT